MFHSLMPGFLAGTMHETSCAVAVAVAFSAFAAVAFSAFAAGAVAQIALGTASTATTLKVSVPVLFAGLTLFTVGMWLPSLPVFVIGAIVTGAGGLLPRRVHRLSAPVIALGVATEYVAARDVMLVFVVLAAIAVAAGVRAVLHHHSDHR